MSEINWNILQPVNTAGMVAQGFATGQAMVKQIQTRNALRGYLANPDNPEAYNALAYLNPEAANALETRHAARAKLQRELADQAIQDKAGTLAASGDSAGARALALNNGNFDLATHIDSLDKPAQERAASFLKIAGPLAFKMRQMPGVAQRQAYLQANRGLLEGQGIDPQLIDKFDVSNNQTLEGYIAGNRTIDQMIDDGKVVWHPVGEAGSFATDGMGRPVGSQNPYANHAPATGKPAPAAAVSEVGSALSTGGLPAPVVAGFLGNFDLEGGYTGHAGDGGTSFGIPQIHSPDRIANFERVIGKPISQATPTEQAHFVLWEMQNPLKAGMTVEQRDAILAAKSGPEAASLIDQHYERSKGLARSQRMAAAAHHEAAGTGLPVRISSDADHNDLPVGALYIDPQGNTRRKT